MVLTLRKVLCPVCKRLCAVTTTGKIRMHGYTNEPYTSSPGCSGAGLIVREDGSVLGEEGTVTRPDWDTYWLGVAKAIAARADCRRRKVGCVLVDSHNRLIASGYNGATPGGKSCLAGDCPRGLLSRDQMPSYSDGNQDLSNCISLHAEQNAVATADPARTRGGTAYLCMADSLDPVPPCDMCGKLLRATGIRRVVDPGGEALY